MPFPRLDVERMTNRISWPPSSESPPTHTWPSRPICGSRDCRSGSKDRAPHFPNVKHTSHSSTFGRAAGIHTNGCGTRPTTASAPRCCIHARLRRYGAAIPSLEEACCRVYNDWLIDFCSVSPDRFWGLALISLWNIDNAVKELERCKRAGLRGAAIGTIPAEEMPYSSTTTSASGPPATTSTCRLTSTSFQALATRARALRIRSAATGVHKHKLDMTECTRRPRNHRARSSATRISRWSSPRRVSAGFPSSPRSSTTTRTASRAGRRPSLAAERIHLPPGLRLLHQRRGRRAAALEVWPGQLHVVERLPAPRLHMAALH